MPKITRCPLPSQAHVHAQAAPLDFIDGYVVASSLNPKEAAQIAFDLPGWANALLSLRNTLVAPFGLKTGDTNNKTIFPITYEAPDQMVFGIDDTHLNFRITLLKTSGHIHMGTWVHCNNRLGRTYLALVMPFHVLITRNAMRRISQA